MGNFLATVADDAARDLTRRGPFWAPEGWRVYPGFRLTPDDGVELLVEVSVVLPGGRKLNNACLIQECQAFAYRGGPEEFVRAKIEEALRLLRSDQRYPLGFEDRPN